MRIGAPTEFKMKDLRKMDNLYQFIVYKGYDDSEYITSCTPECAQAIDSYLDCRKRYGEKIDDEPPLARDQFD